MKTKALCFPHIIQSLSPWFTRALLYWDEVGAIVPWSFVKNPEQLGEHMRSLIQEELLTQVIPGFYVWQIPRFKESFLEYLNNLGPELDLRRKKFMDTGQFGTYIHIEKLDSLGWDLSDLKLATKPDQGPSPRYPWVRVEKTTGQEFMCYLAVTLGRFEELKFTPITNDPSYLDLLIRSSHPPEKGTATLSPLRTLVLDSLLPSPSQPLDATGIRAFKERHGDELTRFRRRIEMELTEVGDMNDENLKSRRLNLFLEEAEDTIKSLRSKMKRFGWLKTTLASVSAVIGAFPGTSWAFGLAGAVMGAFPRSQDIDSNSPLLYAALTRKELSIVDESTASEK